MISAAINSFSPAVNLGLCGKMRSGYVMATLYVGDLHPSVTERMLVETFRYAGPLHSIRLCRDKITGSSLGYACVSFQHQADAERAVEMFNFELLRGQPMRVMPYQSDESVRKTGMGNLFIRNLDKSIDSMALFDTFSAFGKVLSCKVAGYETGSKGYGYVQFQSPEAADLAIEKLNGKLLNDRQVIIEHFRVREERKAEPGPRSRQFTNIYIKNLGEDVDDKMLNNIFSKFGPAASVRVMRDENGKSKGFGFVRFERHEDAQRAIERMNGKELRGRRLHVSQAQTKVERQSQLNQKVEQSLNLYIKNLGSDVDDERLREKFSSFGTIASAKVMMENGRSRGFGFVRFASSQEATNAMKEMNGRMWGRKPVYVSVAQSKEERQAYLAHQNAQRRSSMQFYAVENIYQGVPPPCYMLNTIPEAQNVAAFYTPSQEVDPRPNLKIYPAVDSIASVDPFPAEDSVPTVVPVAAEDGISTVAPVAAEDGISTGDTVPAEDNISAVVHIATEDGISTVVPVAAEDGISTVDTVPAEENISTVDPVPSEESVPVFAPPPAVESVPAVSPVPAINSVPGVQPVPTEESLSFGAPLPAVDSVLAVPAEESLPLIQSVPDVDSPPVKAPSKDAVPATAHAPDADDAPFTSVTAQAKVQQDEHTTNVPTSPPVKKPLTIYMLESAPIDDQIQMAYEYMLPLVEDIHPTQAKKITWMLLEGENNCEIMNMIGDPERLRARVDKMDALLKAREAGHKPETLKMLFNNTNSNSSSKRKRKNKKNKRRN